MNEAKMNSDQVVATIIPAFRNNAILLGLLSEKFPFQEYKTEKIDGQEYSVQKRILPNEYARLDLITIDGEPAGSIVCCEIANSIYHMVGMFVSEKYRSSKKTPQEVAAPQNHTSRSEKQTSPAKFLLAGFLEEMLALGKQVSLEVLNHNAPAWHLYEKKLVFDSLEKRMIGFRLMNKEEILNYVRLRGKKIGKWHDIKTSSDEVGLGVQWRHVPDFDGTSRWSINRLYLINSGAKEFKIDDVFFDRSVSIGKVCLTVIKYGSVFRFVKLGLKKMFNFFGNNKAQNNK